MPKRSSENRTIPVILLVDDKHLGEKYEQVRVAPVYARNILFPQNMAIAATKVNVHNFAKKMQLAEEKRKQRAGDIEEFLMKVQHDGGLEFHAKVNEKGHLYGGIGEDTIIAKIQEIYSLELPTHYVKMKKKLSEVGEHQVVFQYRDVKKNVLVKIIGEMDKMIAEKAESLKTDEVVEKSDEMKKVEMAE